MNKLELSKFLYKREIIIKAINDFGELALITLDTKENYYICVFNSCYYDVQQTVDEFENYLIDLSSKG